MRKFSKYSLVSVLTGLLALPALMNTARTEDDKGYEKERSVSDGSPSSMNQPGQMPGTVDRSPGVSEPMGQSTSQPGEMGQSEQQAGEAAAPMSDQAKQKAQQDLAPHALMIETSLKGALTDIQGLRAELKVNEDKTPSSSFISHFKMLGKEINDSLKKAKTHEKELQGGVKKHPDIAKTQDYRSVSPSLNEVFSLNTNWQAKVGSSEYWKNPQAVMNDLDKLESRINGALDKTQAFNSAQLDLTKVG